MARTQDEKLKFPYASRKDTIKIFKLINERKEPTPINEEKLRVHQIGNPVYVIALLKTLGFLDENGKLESCAEDLRGTGKEFTKCLEERIKETYKDLFDTVKEAIKPEEVTKVEEYFRTHIKNVKASMLSKITNCFLTLRDIINTGGDLGSLESKESRPLKEFKKGKRIIKPDKIVEGEDLPSNTFGNKYVRLILNLNINIDIGTSKEALEELFRNILTARKGIFGE